MLEVRRLRMLLELHRHGTVGGAATALRQSPSSVSQGLALLEREVGVPLLRRAGRGVDLTAAGVLLAERAQRIVDLLEEAEVDIHAVEGEVTGRVHVAAFQSAALALMPQVLAAMARAHPRVRMTMTQRQPAQALRDLTGRQIDLMVAEEYPGAELFVPPELDRTDLADDALHLTLPRTPGPWNAIRDLAGAAGLPWVLEPVGTESRAFAVRSCHAAGFDPDARFTVDDLDTQLTLIESGLAVTILPGLMLTAHPRDVRLVPLPGAPHRRLMTVTRRSLAATPPITACRAILAEVVAQLP